MKTRLRPLLLLMFCLSAVAGPEKDVAGNALYDKPAKQFEFMKVNCLKSSGTLIVPSLYLDLMSFGKGRARTQTSALQSMAGKVHSNVSASAEAIVPLDLELARRLAQELHDDFVAQLRSQGWTVLTWEDIQDDPALSKLKLDKVDENLGAPIIKWTDGVTSKQYLRVAPEGMQVWDGGLTGPLFKMAKLAKQRNANLVLPTYTFDTAALELSSERRYSTLSASAGVAPELRLAAFRVDLFNPKGAGGALWTTEPRLLNEEAGEVVSQEDTSPEFANALSASLGMLAGTGSITRKSGNYVMQVNAGALEAGVRESGRSCNDIAVRVLSLYREN